MRGGAGGSGPRASRPGGIVALGSPFPGPEAQKLWPGLRVEEVLPHQGSQGKMGHRLRGARVLGLGMSTHTERKRNRGTPP